MATLRALVASAKGWSRLVGRAEMVAVGVGRIMTALSVESGVGVAVGNSMMVGVGVGVMVVLCCSRV